jgi:TolB-like protein/AraC-like DNA-binding protein
MYETNPAEHVFIAKLTEIIESNIAKENFGVNELARAAGMTSFTLRRKLRAVSKKSINQFIREIRLQKAMEILQQEEITASEVAYKVGFGSPAYFTKCFHEYFGYPPGEAKNRNNVDLSENNDNSANNPVDETEIPERKKSMPKITFFVTGGILLFFIIYMFFNNFSFESFSIIPGNRLKSEDKSIAVLPFKNLSENEENQYFADGVMEDILNLLYRVREFKVVSRTSVEQFRGSTRSAPEIAKKLGVNFILEGSVQRYGDKVRINVQLIDARHDQQILSEKIRQGVC